MQRTLLIALALAAGTAVEMAARSAPQSPGALQLIALANAGVLVDDGRRSVVIDGAFRDGIPPYGTLPEAMRRQLEHAEGRFARVRALLVTHWHADHFDPTAVGTHLQHNSAATAVVAGEVAERIERGFEGAAGVRGRVRGVTPEPGSHEAVALGDVEVVVVRLRHNPTRNYPEQHVAQAVRLGGRLLIHVGDAERTADNFRAVEPLAPVDVALVPFWFVTTDDGRRIVREQLHAREVVALHVPPGDAVQVRREVEAAWPGAHTLTRPGQTVSLARP